jgi:DNA modification methylase
MSLSELDLDLWAEDAPEDVEPQIDKAEELRVKWGVESGQLWQLGEHRLVCGDCTDRAVVERVMGGEKADLVFTDPPYGVSYVGQNNPGGRNWNALENDELRGTELQEFIRNAFINIYEFTNDDTALYCWHASSTQREFENALNECGYEVKQQLIWNKGMVLGHSDYHWAHEPVFYCRKTGQKTHWFGFRTDKTILGERRSQLQKFTKETLLQIVMNMLDTSTTWEIDRDSVVEYQHSTQKPVRLAERAISNSSMEGTGVIDFFLGSGTTLIACERLGRKCRAVEISPAYVAVAIQRWVDVTGKEPVLLDT